jgi:ABC-2 type transport system ATP-binding protein
MTAPAIAIENLSKRFVRPLPRLRRVLRRKGPDVVEALREVSFEVQPGEVFGLVGRNGQGKTTLIKSTCGLLEPSSGRVRVFGHDTVRAAREVKRRVGLVSADERSFYYRLTGRENLGFFARLQGLSERDGSRRIEELSQVFELPEVIDRPFQEYSTGNKQRLAIVRALLTDPPLLLLDEPTRSLDPISAEALRRVIRDWASRSEQQTVLITTHNLSEIESLCGRVAILSRGKLIECATLDALREKYLGKEKVTLRVRGAVTAELFSRHARSLELELSPLPTGETAIALTRRAGDDALHHVVSACLEASLHIVGCDTEHFGLMQVLETIEARQTS